MKVICKYIYNEQTNRHQNSSPWLTPGKEYLVLEIGIYPGKNIKYRLVGDNQDKSPSLFSSKQFEIISGKLPKNWKINQLECGSLYLSPESWRKAGFWEDCYDGDPTALEIYKREAKIIKQEEDEL